MHTQQLNGDVSVCGQLRPTDIPQVHALGFRSILCNRPDGEAADQPLFSAIENAAKLSGIEVIYIPVGGMGVQAGDVTKLAQAYGDLPKPMLAYCRSGARSAAIVTAALDQLAAQNG